MNFLTVGSKLNKRILKEAMLLERTLGMSPEEAREQAKRMEMNTFKADVRTGIECMLIFKEIAAEMGLNDNNKVKQTYFITIRPDTSEIYFSQFYKLVMDFVKRKCFNSYYLTFEQKGVTPEEYGKGFHCHIVAEMKQRSKTEVLRDTISTFKKCTSANCIQVDILKTTDDVEKTKSYLTNYTSDDNHKMVTKEHDEAWRNKLMLLPVYACPIKSEGQAVTTNENYTVELA